MQDYAKRVPHRSSPRDRLAPIFLIVSSIAIIALFILLLLQKGHEKPATHILKVNNKTAVKPQNPVTEYDFYTELTHSAPDNALKSQATPPPNAK